MSDPADKMVIHIRAIVPADKLNAWLQHLRDFDTANPGGHFEIFIDGPNMPMAEMIQTLQINPAFKFAHFFKRGG